MGNAGNITSYWAGFKQYNELKSTGLPQVLGVQAAGSAPLVLGHPVEKPETVATAIRIGKPARGEQALQAAEESKGRIIAATDEQILHMQKTLATLEGIWVEPASAAGLAGSGDRDRKWKVECERQTHRRDLHRSWVEGSGYHHEGYAKAAASSRQSWKHWRKSSWDNINTNPRTTAGQETQSCTKENLWKGLIL